MHKDEAPIALHVQANTCVPSPLIPELGQVQKIYSSFQKTLIFSFKFNCGVICLMFSLKSS